jgi:hypothetical protein
MMLISLRDKNYNYSQEISEELTGACLRLKFPHRFDFFKVWRRAQLVRVVSAASSFTFCCFIGFPS